MLYSFNVDRSAEAVKMDEARKEELFKQILERIRMLMNTSNPLAELNKLVTLEYSTNPDAKDMGHLEVLSAVIIKLATFYGDQKLVDLWETYLLMVDPLLIKMSA
jgi:hypothetical protein